MSPKLSTLKSKNILIAVTGSIAAYKAAMLARLLVSEGASVKFIMSSAAKDFITPLTLATVSQNPILVENFDPENGAWNSHIRLGEWADYYLIAPATANTIAKMRAGIADNLLLCTYLSARCPVAIAPAMDYDMYLHPTTTQNIEYLESIGVRVIEPGEGFLASGLIGKGRMCEPHEIVSALCSALSEKPLYGRRILITAGATAEAIDPVRYISNHSTGTMGYALADSLANMGATVTLVSGTATAVLSSSEVKVVRTTTAKQMYNAVDKAFETTDVAIFCAAVADFTPSKISTTKIKERNLTLELVPTKDIAAEMGRRKRPDQLTVCFALETNNEKINALAKMAAKNADAIVLNSLQDLGAGFGESTNKVTIFSKDGSAQEFPLKNKREVAADIAQKVVDLLAKD